MPILKSEVEYAIKKLKNGKSPGTDNYLHIIMCQVNLLKKMALLLTVITQLLTYLCQQIWSTNKWPDAWTTSVIIPLP